VRSPVSVDMQTPRRSLSHHPRIRSIAAVAALAVSSAACGSGGDTVSDTATVGDGALVVLGDGVPVEQPAQNAATSDLTEEEQALAFAECMRDEGLDWPDPTTSADGSIDITGGLGAGAVTGPSSDFAAAADVCAPLVEGASFLPGAGGIDAETQDLLLDFTQCLRDEGVEVDDFDTDAIGRGGILGEFDPQDPANADPIQACQSLFVGGIGG